MRFERGRTRISVDPAGNQVEHAGRSQVNVIRSSNSGIDRIALDDRWEGERFPVFPLLQDGRSATSVATSRSRSQGRFEPRLGSTGRPSDQVVRSKRLAHIGPRLAPIQAGPLLPPATDWIDSDHAAPSQVCGGAGPDIENTRAATRDLGPKSHSSASVVAASRVQPSVRANWCGWPGLATGHCRSTPI